MLIFDPAARLADRIWFWRPTELLRGALGEVVGLVAPVWCVGCGAPDVDLCPQCSADLRSAVRRPFRAEAGAEALPIRPDPASEAGFSVLPVLAAARYDGVVSQAVLAYKDREFVGLERILAPALARAVRAADAALTAGRDAHGGLLLVAPPRSLHSRLRRSFDPVVRLVDRAGLGVDVARLLRGRSLATAQKGSGRAARRRRLAGTMIASGAAAQDVLMIDDVLTTGATLAEMHRALTASGHRVHGAAVLAAAPRSSPSWGDDDFPAAR